MNNELRSYPVRSRPLRRLLPGLVVLLFGLGQPALAQDAPAAPDAGAAPGNEQLEELAEVRREIETVGEKLQAIEQAAVAANPQLRERQEQFRAMLMETMQENGYAPQENLDRLREIQSRLDEAETLPSEQRVELMQEFQQRVWKLQEAEQQALQDQQVQAARRDLASAMITAMKEQDPQTDALIERMRQAHQRLQEMLPVGPGAAPAN